MIIRKPYAFLIKNFRKIHIFLLILSLFVVYKLIDVSKFVNDFMSLGIYDLFSDPITKHITIFLNISLLLLTIGSLALVFLLRHKGKPWKLYLMPTITYFALFLVLNMIKNFFRNYTIDVATTDLRFSRDLLMIFFILQIPAIGIYLMRIFGWDIKKFNFNADKEFLELSEEDREEIEIGLDIDKNTFIRLYKRLVRNIGYVYQEHKTICKSIIGVFIVIVLFIGYKTIFITHKSYREGDFYSINGYTFRINKTYITDKDFNGKVIERKSKFIVVDLTIKNNSAPRTIYLENFHIKNSTSDYITTNQTYASEFKDLGDTYESTRELKRNEEIAKVIHNRRYNKNDVYVFYYQKNNEQKTRVCISVSKKLGIAVVRNKIKRQIREMITDIFDFEKEFDFVIIVKKQFLDNEFTMNKEKIKELYLKTISR